MPVSDNTGLPKLQEFRREPADDTFRPRRARCRSADAGPCRIAERSFALRRSSADRTEQLPIAVTRQSVECIEGNGATSITVVCCGNGVDNQRLQLTPLEHSAFWAGVLRSETLGSLRHTVNGHHGESYTRQTSSAMISRARCDKERVSEPDTQRQTFGSENVLATWEPALSEYARPLDLRPALMMPFRSKITNTAETGYISQCVLAAALHQANEGGTRNRHRYRSQSGTTAA